MTATMTVRTMTLTLLLAGMSLALGTGCSGDQPRSDETNGSEVSATPEGTTSSGDTTSGPDATEVQTYTFHGVVKEIDRNSNMITIDHEKIGDFMDAMTMPFTVADPAILDQVHVGDSTHFTLRVAGDQVLITKVQEGHEEGEEH